MTTMPVFPVLDVSFPIYDSVCWDIGILVTSDRPR